MKLKHVNAKSYHLPCQSAAQQLIAAGREFRETGSRSWSAAPSNKAFPPPDAALLAV